MKIRPHYPDLQLLILLLLSCCTGLKGGNGGRRSLALSALSNVFLNERRSQVPTSVEMKELFFTVTSLKIMFWEQNLELKSSSVHKTIQTEILVCFLHCLMFNSCRSVAHWAGWSSGLWSPWALKPRVRGLTMTSSQPSIKKTYFMSLSLMLFFWNENSKILPSCLTVRFKA